MLSREIKFVSVAWVSCVGLGMGCVWCGDDNIWVNINTGDVEDAGGEEGNTGDTGSDELS